MPCAASRKATLHQSGAAFFLAPPSHQTRHQQWGYRPLPTLGAFLGRPAASRSGQASHRQSQKQGRFALCPTSFHSCRQRRLAHTGSRRARSLPETPLAAAAPAPAGHVRGRRQSGRVSPAPLLLALAPAVFRHGLWWFAGKGQPNLQGHRKIGRRWCQGDLGHAVGF